MYKFAFIDTGIGEIHIDDFVELFESDLSYWSEKQYISQWKAASIRIEKKLPAYFITSITEPQNSNFIRAWVCYPIDEELVFQEHIIFLDNLSEPFNETDPHKHILPYERVDEDGEEISEWCTCS